MFSIMKLSAIKAGTRVKCDGGFTCMGEGEEKTVLVNDKGELYVPCDEGRHLIEGQYCSRGEHGVKYPHYIGFFPV